MSRYPFIYEEEERFRDTDQRIDGLTLEMLMEQQRLSAALALAQERLQQELNNTRLSLSQAIQSGDDSLRREVGKVLVKSKIAQEPISALQLLYATTPNNVGVASCDAPERTNVMGIALTAALTGEVVYVREFGEVVDGFFHFAAGPVFLGEAGAVVNEVPATARVLVQVGRSLGNGGILFQPTFSVVME